MSVGKGLGWRSVARWAAVCLVLGATVCLAQTQTVTGRIELMGGVPAHGSQPVGRNSPLAVLWLTPLDAPVPPLPPPEHGFRLVQKNKTFEPHVLVIPVGTAVEFPNLDPFFHNVFSLFEGKRFDLGLYEAGGTRTVHFDRPGVSYIFCNIHPEMGAVVLALRTPYYTVAGTSSEFVFANVPEGHYRLEVWSELALPESLQAAAREVVISGTSHSLGTISIASIAHKASHKNKYGTDYDPPSTPPYLHP